MVICVQCENEFEKYYVKRRKLCQKCYKKRRTNKTHCSKCGKHKIVEIIINNLPICYICSLKDRVCVICNEIRPIETNTEFGPVCARCYKVPSEICSICERYKEVHSRKDNKPICVNCYRKIKRKETKPNVECVFCNKIKPKYKKTKFGLICLECHLNPLKKCCICGKNKKVNKIGENGAICIDCYEQPKEQCSRCPNIKKVAKRDKNKKPVCINCYIKERMETDINFRTAINVKKHIQNAFKKFSETGKIQPSKKYGIDVKAIIEHLGPCPGSREKYHIDHIKPLCSFNLDNPEQIKLAFAPENHQWLTKEENLKKGSKIL